jgi:hypothetical protein
MINYQLSIALLSISHSSLPIQKDFAAQIEQTPQRSNSPPGVGESQLGQRGKDCDRVFMESAQLVKTVWGF